MGADCVWSVLRCGRIRVTFVVRLVGGLLTRPFFWSGIGSVVRSEWGHFRRVRSGGDGGLAMGWFLWLVAVCVSFNSAEVSHDVDLFPLVGSLTLLTQPHD